MDSSRSKRPAARCETAQSPIHCVAANKRCLSRRQIPKCCVARNDGVLLGGQREQLCFFRVHVMPANRIGGWT
jgi:hypothetical protein